MNEYLLPTIFIFILIQRIGCDYFCTAEEYLIAIIFALRRPSLRSGQSQRRTFSPKAKFIHHCLHYHHCQRLVMKHNEAIIISQHHNFDLESVVHWYIQPDTGRNWILQTFFPG